MLLLDTNVISELRKVSRGQVHPNFAAWAKTLRWSDLYLSAITIHELEIGVSRLAQYDAMQADILRDWLDNKVLQRFASRILPVDTAVATHSARILLPRTRPLEDALIAATAYVHRMKIVTRNQADFEDYDIEVVNPWAAV